MKTNHTNATRYAKNLQANQNRQQQEEFGSEFEVDAASAQVNNFAETLGKTDIKQPVSERTAWH